MLEKCSNGQECQFKDWCERFTEGDGKPFFVAGEKCQHFALKYPYGRARDTGDRDD